MPEHDLAVLDLEQRGGELAGPVASVARALSELEHDQHFVGLLVRYGLDHAAARH